MTNLAFYVHAGSLCIAALGIFLADKSALAWISGRRATLNERDIFVAHWVVTTGLCGLILSGLYLFWPLRDYLIGQPLFWLKMTFVFALVVNSFFIDRLTRIAVERPYASLSRRERLPLIISGAVSTISWIGAVTVAFLLFQDVFIDFFI